MPNPADFLPSLLPTSGLSPRALRQGLATGEQVARMGGPEWHAHGAGFGPPPGAPEWAYAELVSEILQPIVSLPYAPPRYRWRELVPTQAGTLEPVDPVRGDTQSDYVIFPGGGAGSGSGSGSDTVTPARCLVRQATPGYWLVANGPAGAQRAGLPAVDTVTARLVTGVRMPTRQLTVFASDGVITEPGSGSGVTPYTVYVLARRPALVGVDAQFSPDQFVTGSGLSACRSANTSCCHVEAGKVLYGCCPTPVPTVLYVTFTRTAGTCTFFDLTDVALTYMVNPSWPLMPAWYGSATSAGLTIDFALACLDGGGGRAYWSLGFTPPASLCGLNTIYTDPVNFEYFSPLFPTDQCATPFHLTSAMGGVFSPPCCPPNTSATWTVTITE